MKALEPTTSMPRRHAWLPLLGLALLAAVLSYPALADEIERVAAPIPTTRVALVDVTDGSHYSQGGMATAAAVGVLDAMADVGSIQIVSPEAVVEAVDARGLMPPFEAEQLHAIAEAVGADLAVSVRIAGLLYIDHTDQGVCALRMRVLDRRARMDVTTFQVCGRADQNGEALGERGLVEKAIHEAAYAAVQRLTTALTVRGTISIPFDKDRIRLNVGSDEGLRVGTRLAVWDNNEWVADLEVTEASTLGARAKILKGDYDALYPGIAFFVTAWPETDRQAGDYQEGEIDKARDRMP